MEKYLKELSSLVNNLQQDQKLQDAVGDITDILVTCLESDKKVLVAGNGGSAADAQHFVAELVGRYKKERKGYPAIAITTDTSILTAWTNDYDFDSVFSRQVQALGNSGDVFIGISTSGNSPNVIKATQVANELGMETVAFTGKGGGELVDYADISVVVPSDDTPRVQEVHGFLIHVITEELENKLVDHGG